MRKPSISKSHSVNFGWRQAHILDETSDSSMIKINRTQNQVISFVLPRICVKKTREIPPNRRHPQKIIPGRNLPGTGRILKNGNYGFFTNNTTAAPTKRRAKIHHP
jgi:hypothetical protein